MAKATLVNAVLDARLRRRAVPSPLPGSGARPGRCGVSVRIAPSTDALLEQGHGLPRRGLPPHQAQDRAGHRRRTGPRGSGGGPRDPALGGRERRYRLADVAIFRRLDAFGLLMIEQPLHHEDLWEHSLQREIRTDVIRTSRSARLRTPGRRSSSGVPDREHQAGARRRAPRGQASTTSRPSSACRCGGGCSRPGSVVRRTSRWPRSRSLAAGDTSATSRYFAEDLTEPLVLAPDGTLPVPDGPGIGVEPDPQAARGRHPADGALRRSDKTVRAG